jgi:hypothetical protein
MYSNNKMTNYFGYTQFNRGLVQGMQDEHDGPDLHGHLETMRILLEQGEEARKQSTLYLTPPPVEEKRKTEQPERLAKKTRMSLLPNDQLTRLPYRYGRTDDSAKQLRIPASLQSCNRNGSELVLCLGSASYQGVFTLQPKCLPFDSRWVPPVGGAPSRHTSTRGAADGAHDQHLTRGWGVEWCPKATAKGSS